MDINKSNESIAEQFVREQESSIDKPITNFKVPEKREMQMKKEIGNQIGYQKISIDQLPTRGLCYPEGAEIAIRPATTAEIRHWSTINEEDMLAVEDMLNYVAERCIKVKFPNNQFSNYKDLAEVDRMYLIFAIREYTFINSGNTLKINISETKSINVTKDMIDYVNTDELMKYYDPIKRAFVLKVKGGRHFEVVFPTIGVVEWIKDYVKRCMRNQEQYDTVFLDYATFLIKDYRDLNKRNYYTEMVEDSQGWSCNELSVMNYVKKLFRDSINFQVKYTDESGAELTAPLSFRGGIKSLFLISDVSDIYGLLE